MHRERLREVGNLVNLSTPLGLLIARLGRATLVRGPRGLWLAEGYRLPFPVAGAFAVGNVLVTSRTWAEILGRHPDLLAHEERHTWQWLAWGALRFPVAYAAGMAWSMLRTGDRAARNVFERRAGLADGGYVDVPVRPVVPAAQSVLRSIPRRLAERSR